MTSFVKSMIDENTYVPFAPIDKTILLYIVFEGKRPDRCFFRIGRLEFIFIESARPFWWTHNFGLDAPARRRSQKRNSTVFLMRRIEVADTPLRQPDLFPNRSFSRKCDLFDNGSVECYDNRACAGVWF